MSPFLNFFDRELPRRGSRIRNEYSNLFIPLYSQNAANFIMQNLKFSIDRYTLPYLYGSNSSQQILTHKDHASEMQSFVAAAQSNDMTTADTTILDVNIQKKCNPFSFRYLSSCILSQKNKIDCNILCQYPQLFDKNSIITESYKNADENILQISESFGDISNWLNSVHSWQLRYLPENEWNCNYDDETIVLQPSEAPRQRRRMISI